MLITSPHFPLLKHITLICYSQMTIIDSDETELAYPRMMCCIDRDIMPADLAAWCVVIPHSAYLFSYSIETVHAISLYIVAHRYCIIN